MTTLSGLPQLTWETADAEALASQLSSFQRSVRIALASIEPTVTVIHRLDPLIFPVRVSFGSSTSPLSVTCDRAENLTTPTYPAVPGGISWDWSGGAAVINVISGLSAGVSYALTFTARFSAGAR